MAVRIRAYRPQDKKALAQLLADLQDYVAHLDQSKALRKRKDFDAQAHARQTLRYMEKYNGIIYLAEDKAHLVGYIFGIIITIEDNLEVYPSKYGRIVELFVSPECRGKKVGFALMEKMERYFKRKHCQKIKLECLVSNTKAHAFYKKLDFQDNLITMFKFLKN